MIPRIAAQKLTQLASLFKAVAVIGPRQSGKTTLVRALFNEKPYVSLEDPDTRQYALEDPRGFLANYPEGAVLDEVQRTPDLFSYLQGILDERNKMGEFILTGSNNFLLQQNITQSLAGRVAYLQLLPFALQELYDRDAPELARQDKVLLQGCYPPIHDYAIPPVDWFPNYLRTYVERDVRQIKNVTDLIVFERFVRLLAGRSGQELNITPLAVEVGVDIKTIQSWIGILESSFIIFLLRSHFKNFNKTVIKRPKIYFYDTGLVCSLLGITQEKQLETHPLRGSIFETLVVSELVKKRTNTGREINLFYWRDKTGREVDVVIDEVDNLIPVEIKSGKTVHAEFFKNLTYWMGLSGMQKGFVIYGGDLNQSRSNGIQVNSWRDLTLENFL
ncbi:ATP-binding protein [Parapedobacter soli]|uniref:ATP-binding protein n=1 Tax=Parapedobacter soli TaxID=416955 RepID=UPI0021C8DF2E|nr:ATP-binding protein [Parapedobacter soli]